MLIQQKFTPEDIRLIKSAKQGRVHLAIFIKFLVPLSFLLGLGGIVIKQFGYWPTTFVSLLCFLLLTIYLIIQNNLTYQKDILQQLKYTGTFRVSGKLGSNNYIVYTDSKEIQEVDVVLPSVFEQIEVGDELYIEITQSSRYILKLEKGILPLLNGSD